jgi:hypothetical protein
VSVRIRIAGVCAAAAALTLGMAPLASAAMAPGLGPGGHGHARGHHQGHQHHPWDDDGYGSCGYHYCPGYPYGSDYGQGDGGRHSTPYGARADHDPRGRGDWDGDGPDDGWSYWDAADTGCWRAWC